MSYNAIRDMFSQYSKGNPKNCQHLKELFEQAVTQMVEEGEITMLAPNTRSKNYKDSFE